MTAKEFRRISPLMLTAIKERAFVSFEKHQDRMPKRAEDVQPIRLSRLREVFSKALKHTSKPITLDRFIGYFPPQFAKQHRTRLIQVYSLYFQQIAVFAQVFVS